MSLPHGKRKSDVDKGHSKKPKLQIDLSADTTSTTQHYYEPRAYSDLTLHIGGHTFHCHQLRLAEFSAYFVHFFDLSHGMNSNTTTFANNHLHWPPGDAGKIESLDDAAPVSSSPSSTTPFYKTVSWQAMYSLLEHIYNPMDWMKAIHIDSSRPASQELIQEYTLANYLQMKSKFVDEIWTRMQPPLNAYYYEFFEQDKIDATKNFVWNIFENTLGLPDSCPLRKWAIDHVCLMGIHRWLNPPAFVTPNLWNTIHERLVKLYATEPQCIIAGVDSVNSLWPIQKRGIGGVKKPHRYRPF